MTAGEAPRTAASRLRQHLATKREVGALSLLEEALREAAAPPEPPRPPEGTRLILASENLLDEWGTRTEDGARIAVEWGEPDANGWYTPTFTRSAAPSEPPRPELLRQVGEALVAVHTASDGHDMPLVELMDADLFRLVTEAVAAYSARSATPEGQPLEEVDAQGHKILHAVDCWCDPLRLAVSSEHPEASPFITLDEIEDAIDRARRRPSEHPEASDDEA